MVWDALFSRPMRERNENPKLEYLIDVCTSMLLCGKGILLRCVLHLMIPANAELLIGLGDPGEKYPICGQVKVPRSRRHL